MGICFSCCCYCPSQESVALVEKFGRFDRVAYPGFNCVPCCFGDCIAGNLSLRVQQLDVQCESKTRDNVFVHILVSVQYQVQKENVYDAFYRLTSPKQQISSYVFDVVRATVPKMILDDVFLEKEEIAHNIKEQLSNSMHEYGFTIIQALVNDICPAEKVKQAMNEINAAQRLRMAALEQAEASKIQVVKAAEADAEAKYLAGMGMARQRQAIVNGLRESVKEFASDVTDINPRDVLELMLMTQYFDVLKDIGTHNNSSTLFLNHSPANLSDVAGQVRNAFLQAGAAQTMKRD